MGRIFLHPGYVTSKNDGDRHYISADRLANLYGVDLKKCHIIKHSLPESYLGIVRHKDDIHLYPDCYGRYEKLRSY